ncbi:tyrosine-type recombinase/integrase [Paenibacillus sp. S02]|uniref:tyrosine-type recombinase/integrase n=1 Tax=Paenibacillus sp. S02 TaxID=2823904 RepID=UPI001C6465B3|nr:tyrosine-type recombinase/integrase [Paenibacillus sp. S02]
MTIKHNNAPSSVDRKYASLKSLFNYLSQLSENEHSSFPYLKRNMREVFSVNHANNIKTKATRIENEILLDNKIFEFRLFITERFKEIVKYNKRLLNSHLKNVERDLALISLILGSGMRISEAIALDLNDINPHKSILFVIAKEIKKIL